MLRKYLFILFIFCCSAYLIVGCAGLPKDFNRPPSYVINGGQDTRLGLNFSRQLEDHPDQSGVYLLSDGLDAFVGRVLLARMAERSIDLQYYMFHQDTVGQLLIAELLKAADRGVRVRMLIDDIYGSEADDVWTALDSHPNIEVRMFNPFARSVVRNLQWITRFSHVNYRMHSKSFTVDNQAIIVGGRNIGDEYFNANPELAFADLDLLAIGTVVPEVSAAFDQYWNSEYAYPASVLTHPATPAQLEALQEKITQTVSHEEKTTRYVEALKYSNFAESLRQGSAHFAWAPALVIHDSVEKNTRDEKWKEELLISQLWPYMDKTTDELIIVSPYFIPGKKGSDALCMLSQRGVKVRVLTNSLASNDVIAVHAGYSKYRRKLLKAGVELYELDEQITKKAEEKFTWLPGVSKSSLHAKTMVFDKKAMFVGSMNLDARSLHINTEIGILFLNPEIAGKSASTFDQKIDQIAFRLTLHTNENGSEYIRWHLKKDDTDIVFHSEPYAGFWKKLEVGFIRLLPVESLL
jgi:putative cardiolipin synthase